jgi:hypothetical protein
VSPSKSIACIRHWVVGDAALKQTFVEGKKKSGQARSSSLNTKR